MNKLQKDVRQYHEKFGVSTKTKPDLVQSPNDLEMIDTLTNCFKQLLRSVGNRDLAEISKNITESMNTLVSMSLQYGIDLEPIWNEYCKANMEKVLHYGKIKTPDNWKSPDYKDLLKQQGWEKNIRGSYNVKK